MRISESHIQELHQLAPVGCLVTFSPPKPPHEGCLYGKMSSSFQITHFLMNFLMQPI